MKANIYLSYLSFFAGLSLVQAQESALRLKGTVKHSDAEYVYLHRFENKTFTVIDSAKVSKKAFSFTNRVPLPDLYGVSLDKENVPAYVFLDQGATNIALDGEAAAGESLKVKGSKAHALFEAYKKEKQVNISDFIKQHPDEIVSSYVLYRDWSYKLSPEELERNIALLSPAQQQSRYTKDLRKIIEVVRQVAVGKKAPAIVAADPDGKQVALYDNLGKYTLIDFWASWCPPCRRENPNIVANYQKYKDQGFQIYAVSLDKKKEPWLKGIADDKLTWLHVSELRYWDSEIAAAYAVRAIPANFLVDDQGIIVAKNVKGERLGAVLDSLFNDKKDQGSERVGLGWKNNTFKGQDPIAFESTENREIDKQQKQIFSTDDRVFFSNESAGSRLNSLTQSADGVYQILIAPERTPINQSPWYAFEAWATQDTTIQVQINYADGFYHRYDPKISQSPDQWTKITNLQFIKEGERNKAVRFSLALRAKPIWIAAQENIPSEKVYSWLENINPKVHLDKKEVGKTALQAPLYVYGAGNAESKKRLIVMGRQHPPEITGHYAYAGFVDYLLGDTPDARAFREAYYVYFIPVANPDGVDEGHWRANANGADLNRDWDAFHQPETQALRDYFQQEIKAQGRELYFAIDFHSTGKDIYYTVDPNLKSRFPGFVPEWIASLRNAVPGYEPHVKPLYFEGPTFTAYSYFYKNYDAEALVYEIGDDTEPKFIDQKAKLSAQKLIEKLTQADTKI
ncbi:MULTISPECIES: redoxin domain-containing protein [Sphingobacterium]|uniref:Redoxin domain-containing protein n=1 Tax=Sphingobacterium populi TaxID=1812824 RepID=A0ABW5UE60_9SPHI|nr:redoxin domain-containing protein [Sphingobacterium sp. CFCC 11742]